MFGKTLAVELLKSQSTVNHKTERDSKTDPGSVIGTAISQAPLTRATVMEWKLKPSAPLPQRTAHI